MRGHVAIGIVTACASLDLPDRLPDFHHHHPAVEITLSEANSDRLIEALHDGRLDMASVGLATAPPPGIETQVVADEPIAAAVNHGDPLTSLERRPSALGKPTRLSRG